MVVEEETIEVTVAVSPDPAEAAEIIGKVATIREVVVRASPGGAPDTPQTPPTAVVTAISPMATSLGTAWPP